MPTEFLASLAAQTEELKSQGLFKQERLIAGPQQAEIEVRQNGASAEVIISGATPVTGNDPDLLRKMVPTLAWAAGDDKIGEGSVVMGAEDFSFFQEHIPGLFLHLGIYDSSIPGSDRPALLRFPARNYPSKSAG